MNLDDALSAWAESARLPGAVAEAIGQRITATPVPVPVIPAGLDPRWWRRFNTTFTATIIASTRPVPVAA